MKPVLEQEFYHDGRGPSLVRAIWGFAGAQLRGFEYFNPDAAHDDSSLRHLLLEKVEAYSMASEEVHGNIIFDSNTKAAIFDLGDSDWKGSFNPRHLADCSHFQIVFYDEIFDVMCKRILPGKGALVEPAV